MDYSTLSLILLAAGILVIVVEMFIPSAGILGFVAASFLIGGVVVAFMHSVFFGLAVLTGTSLAMPLLFWLLVKVWPMTPLGKAILMNDTIDNVVPESKTEALVGQVGIAKTKMLPSGIVEIDGRQHDAVSEGFAINPGDTVKVVSSRGNRVYVEPYDGEVGEDGRAVARDTGPLSTPLEELGIDEDLYE
jgi:membrane-bound serine protease (ClpP class)